jgi:hypothetical protein
MFSLGLECNMKNYEQVNKIQSLEPNLYFFDHQDFASVDLCSLVAVVTVF